MKCRSEINIINLFYKFHIIYVCVFPNIDVQRANHKALSVENVECIQNTSNNYTFTLLFLFFYYRFIGFTFIYIVIDFILTLLIYIAADL